MFGDGLLFEMGGATNFIIFFYFFLLVHSIPKHNMLVIGGDMNAQIGKNGNNKYSLHNTSNRNGQHLTDFIIENRLACLNTNYQKREGKLWTHTYAKNTKAQRLRPNKQKMEK